MCVENSHTLCLHSKNILYLKSLFLKFKVLHVFKTHFDCFNGYANNLDYMEKEQLLYRQSNILEKLNGWLSAGEEIYESKLVSSNYLENIT